MSDATASHGSGAVPLEEVQAGIFDPAAPVHEKHLWLRITDADRAKAFLRSILELVTTEAQCSGGSAPAVRTTVGFTWQGLAALGVRADVLGSFPEEFSDGMAARADILGDNGPNAPSNWSYPYGSEHLHMWLMVQGDDASAVDQRADHLDTAASGAGGVDVIGREEGTQLGPDHAPAKEHFGFNDNLSQPGVDGVGQPVNPGQGTLQPDGTWTSIPVGCFLLGYPNGYGEVVNRPADDTLRRNGTYMVFRKLEQDVPAFRRYVSETAQMFAVTPELCAAKFVGRWKSGVPLELSPEHDDPSILDRPASANSFGYGARDLTDADADGVKVPHFSHIRRVNPRDSLGPDAVVDTTNHRIIRRSAPYGPYLPEGVMQDDGNRRGLLFRAFNASILDQFELIQSKWVNSGNDAHGLSSDRDPFVGSVEPVGPAERRLGASFPMPTADGGCPTRYGLPRFVTVRGGEYLFVPAIAALRALSAPAEPQPAQSDPPAGDFVEQYQKIASQIGPRPDEIGRQLVGLVLYAQSDPVALGRSLRKDDATKIFPTPIATLLGAAADINEVFNRDDVFSVSGYGDRLSDISGPFMLGLDRGPRYERETAIMRLVAPSSDLPGIAAWLDRYAATVVHDAVVHDAVTTASGDPSSFDLVTQVANRIPLGFVNHYFGVPGHDDATFMSWLRGIGVVVFEFWSNLVPGVHDYAASIGPLIEEYIDWVIQARLAAMRANDPSVPDDVLTRLLGLTGLATGTPASPVALDLVGIRRNLIGFSVGSAVASSAGIVNAVQYLLDPAHHDALALTSAAAVSGDSQLMSQCMLEAARLATPSPPSLFRTATMDHVLGRNTPREKTIAKGTVVALYPCVAMTDPDFVDDPEEFRPGRPAGVYLMFGEGTHNCFGTAIGTMLLASAGRALFGLEDLRAVSGAMSGAVSGAMSGVVSGVTSGEGIPNMFYPGRYLLSGRLPS